MRKSALNIMQNLAFYAGSTWFLIMTEFYATAIVRCSGEIRIAV